MIDHLSPMQVYGAAFFWAVVFGVIFGTFINLLRRKK